VDYYFWIGKVKKNLKLLLGLFCFWVVFGNPIERELISVPVEIGLEMFIKNHTLDVVCGKLPKAPRFPAKIEH